MISELLETASVFILDTIAFFGHFGVFFLMLLESANIPLPSEVIMTYAGFLAASGKLNFWLVVFLGGFGNLIGALISYGIGFYFKERAYGFFERWFLITPESFLKAASWVKDYGQTVAFFSRMLPVVRTFISVPAGIFSLPLAAFSIYTFSGSFLWSLFLAYLGFVLGENWAVAGSYLRQFDAVIAFSVLAAVVYWVVKHLRRRRTSKKNRGIILKQ